MHLRTKSLSDISILCIGDSLTEGDYGSEPQGTAYVKDENYPFYMQQLLKCRVSNQGVCGYSASAYWKLKLMTIDFESISPDIILIMLGTNAGLTDTVETDTKISDGDTFRDYADTNTGAYCKIIEYCMNRTNFEAQIILCTPTHVGKARPVHRSAVANAYPVVLQIAKKYSLPVIDLYKEGGFSDYNDKVMQPIDTLHFGRIGYSRLGTFIGSKVMSLCSFVYPEK